MYIDKTAISETEKSYNEATLSDLDEEHGKSTNPKNSDHMSNPDNVSIIRPGSAASRGGRRSRIEDPS